MTLKEIIDSLEPTVNFEMYCNNQELADHIDPVVRTFLDAKENSPLYQNSFYESKIEEIKRKVAKGRSVDLPTSSISDSRMLLCQDYSSGNLVLRIMHNSCGMTGGYEKLRMYEGVEEKHKRTIESVGNYLTDHNLEFELK